MKSHQERLLCAIVTVLAVTEIGIADEVTRVWDPDELSRTPGMKWIDSSSQIRSLTYDGEVFAGRKTSVFAFYATPGTIKGDTSNDRNLPAVVLI
ncbi:MAG: hypothetical protein GY826_00805, partial [Fuerstiella sp.]|nr:hypothetical protein [Fuerstiella sp.]